MEEEVPALECGPLSNIHGLWEGSQEIKLLWNNSGPGPMVSGAGRSFPIMSTQRARQADLKRVTLYRNLAQQLSTLKGERQMAEFVNPFGGIIPERNLSDDELIRVIRLNIAAEHEAIHLYMAHAEAVDHPLAKKVLIDIANEERVHVGEFERLLEILTGDEAKWVAEGREEVDEMAAEMMPAISAGAEKADVRAAQAGVEEKTIGSLRP
jgi:hypothetical protein